MAISPIFVNPREGKITYCEFRSGIQRLPIHFGIAIHDPNENLQKSPGIPGTESIRAASLGRYRDGATVMPTAREYRAEAKACRELADRTTEVCVKAALTELSQNYERAARQTERRERDFQALGVSGNTR
jgi:hypothetical protein